MKVTEIDYDFLMMCAECGDLIGEGYEIELTQLEGPVALCCSCSEELSKYLLQETYLKDI